MTEMFDSGIVATGEEAVRHYLRGLGMPGYDIGVYLDEARQGPGPATFSFGTNDSGFIPEFRLAYEGSEFVLTDGATRRN
jgi:hypothetical protein